MTLDYQSIISDQTARMIDVLETGPLDAPVPGTPGWNLADLGAHLFDVQTWATHVIAHGKPSDEAGHTPGSRTPAEALTQSCAGLLAVLEEAEPSDPCWNFTKAEQTKAFWFRRQALEVAVHRWDAESAVSPSPTGIEAELAADVVDEYLHFMLQRVSDREGIDLANISESVRIRCTDSDLIPGRSDWTLSVIDGEVAVTDQRETAVATIEAPAATVALFAYNRAPEGAVSIDGDRTALASWSTLFGL